MITFDWVNLAIVLSGYVLLLFTSGKIVNCVLYKVSHIPIAQKIGKETRDTGFVIGKCENLLILTFMLLGAYTALALIFTAKTVIRKEDIHKNSLYFLAGTMVNLTYSVLIGIIVKILLHNKPF
ncbi:MAG: hypothetical protein LWW94_03225 [Candidatus Desulfofervidaceae bacterium]|nr:hypothetical protein [Candidatus Desulfofervidaceae bacterium]